MIVVSFATRDGVYDSYLDRLRDSCRALDVRCDTELIAPTTRRDACLQKPAFIRDKLREHDEPLLWLDADALVTGRITLPATSWDIGLVPNTSERLRGLNPTSSFLIAAAPTEAAMSFLDTWAYLCANQDLSRRLDHKRLTWTREMRHGSYSEINLQSALSGAVIRDYGGNKQFAL